MEYCATVFSDYSKLYLDEWRKYSMKMTRRGSHFPFPSPSHPSPSPPPPPTKFELYTFFSPAWVSSSMSIYPSNITQLRKIPSVVNRAHIVDTNESAREPNHENSESNTTLGADTCHYFRRKEQNSRDTRCLSLFDEQRWSVFNDIATDRPDDNLIVTVPPRRLLHKMTVSMINCALRNAIYSLNALSRIEINFIKMFRR